MNHKPKTPSFRALSEASPEDRTDLLKGVNKDHLFLLLLICLDRVDDDCEKERKLNQRITILKADQTADENLIADLRAEIKSKSVLIDTLTGDIQLLSNDSKRMKKICNELSKLQRATVETVLAHAKLAEMGFEL